MGGIYIRDRGLARSKLWTAPRLEVGGIGMEIDGKKLSEAK